MRRHLATPQAVVVDTGRDLATVDRDEAGQPLTLDGARELAGRSTPDAGSPSRPGGRSGSPPTCPCG